MFQSFFCMHLALRIIGVFHLLNEHSRKVRKHEALKNTRLWIISYALNKRVASEIKIIFCIANHSLVVHGGTLFLFISIMLFEWRTH